MSIHNNRYKLDKNYNPRYTTELNSDEIKRLLDKTITNYADDKGLAKKKKYFYSLSIISIALVVSGANITEFEGLLLTIEFSNPSNLNVILFIITLIALLRFHLELYQYNDLIFNHFHRDKCIKFLAEAHKYYLDKLNDERRASTALYRLEIKKINTYKIESINNRDIIYSDYLNKMKAYYTKLKQAPGIKIKRRYYLEAIPSILRSDDRALDIIQSYAVTLITVFIFILYFI